VIQISKTHKIDLPRELRRIEGVVSWRDVGVGDGQTIRRLPSRLELDIAAT